MTDAKELILTALRGYDPCPHCCGRASEGAAYDEHQAEAKAMSDLADAIERGEVPIGIKGNATATTDLAAMHTKTNLACQDGTCGHLDGA